MDTWRDLGPASVLLGQQMLCRLEALGDKVQRGQVQGLVSGLRGPGGF